MSVKSQKPLLNVMLLVFGVQNRVQDVKTATIKEMASEEVWSLWQFCKAFIGVSASSLLAAGHV